MQKTEFRNLFNLYGRQIVLLLVLSVGLILKPCGLSAQMNAAEFDLKYSKKPYHFGIVLGYNFSDFKITHSDAFLQSDSILAVEASSGPGFNLGIITNLRLGNHIDLRFIPTLTFAEKNLDYSMAENDFATRKIESIYLEFPLLIKYKSDPHRDFRMYVIGGAKYAYDLASNAKARNAEDQIKVKQNDILAELGFGMEFYFPYFIFSPEIKFSHGLINVHSPDQNLQFSRVVKDLFSRMVTISIHFEG